MTASDIKTGILFVCMGNICRSPTAEGVFAHRVNDLNAKDRFAIDSAGTHAYHVGEPPDRRSVAAARERGYDLSTIRARRVNDEDYHRFDLILAMDQDNLEQLVGWRPDDARADVKLLLDYASDERYRGASVPDPYYGGAKGFEHVLDLVEDATEQLLTALGDQRRV